MKKTTKTSIPATVTGRELATLLRCDASTVTRLRDQPGFPAPADLKSGRPGRYDTRAVFAWLFENRRGTASAREQVFRERADALAMDNASRRGELVLASQVGHFLEALMSELKGALENLPKRSAGVLSGMTDPAMISSHLRHEIRGIRTELAAAIARYQAVGDREHDITQKPAKRAPKKTKRKTVKKKATRKTKVNWRK